MGVKNKIYKVVPGIFTILLFLSCKSLQSTNAVIKQEAITNTGQLTYKRTALREEALVTWSQMDLLSDSIPGISLDRALQLVNGKQASTVIVAIMDSGTDITHKELQPYLWNNTKETTGNDKDDDGNGYTDDLHGWNFLGEAYGAPYALTRLVAKCKELCTTETATNAFCQECRELRIEYEAASAKAAKAYTQAQEWYNESEASEKQKAYYRYILDQSQYHYNFYFNPREIIGDDVKNLNDKQYGNANVKPRTQGEIHGTHVTGIVTQLTGQFTDQIRCMPIRSTPNGDEYDKDVALAIRYAVDNGAKVINMSFGKSYSEYPEWVQEAIQYAAKKDVLLIHAAGNERKNVDVSSIFPNDNGRNGKEISNNFVNVGAITRFFNEALVSDFSNYGRANVDLFAPGSNIHSTLPDNEYGYQQGTSMAAPAVAAVAALIRSYYPKLSAAQVKHILMESGIEVPFEVTVPGRSGEKLPFAEICKSGKILNAYNALLMAEKLSKNL